MTGRTGKECVVLPSLLSRRRANLHPYISPRSSLYPLIGSCATYCCRMWDGEMPQKDFCGVPWRIAERFISGGLKPNYLIKAVLMKAKSCCPWPYPVWRISKDRDLTTSLVPIPDLHYSHKKRVFFHMSNKNFPCCNLCLSSLVFSLWTLTIVCISLSQITLWDSGWDDSSFVPFWPSPLQAEQAQHPSLLPLFIKLYLPSQISKYFLSIFATSSLCSYLLNAFPIMCHSSVKGFLLTIFSKKVNHPEEAAHMPSQHPTIRINGNVLQSNGNPPKKAHWNSLYSPWSFIFVLLRLLLLVLSSEETHCSQGSRLHYHPKNTLSPADPLSSLHLHELLSG